MAKLFPESVVLRPKFAPYTREVIALVFNNHLTLKPGVSREEDIFFSHLAIYLLIFCTAIARMAFV